MPLFFLSLVFKGKSIIISFILPLSESFRDVEISLLILIFFFTSRRYHSPPNCIDTHLSFSLKSPEEEISLFNMSHHIGSVPAVQWLRFPYMLLHIYTCVCVYLLKLHQNSLKIEITLFIKHKIMTLSLSEIYTYLHTTYIMCILIGIHKQINHWMIGLSIVYLKTTCISEI